MIRAPRLADHARSNAARALLLPAVLTCGLSLSAATAHALDYDYSWSLPKPQGNALRSVVFEADDLTGYAVGDGGSVVATTDGGVTWSVRTETGTLLADLDDVMLLGPGDLLAVGSAPYILRSIDGGASWSEVTSPATDHLYDVARVDAITLCALGEGGQVLRSTDNGLTWAQRPSPKNTALKDQLWLDANLGYVLGYQCARRTTNGGLSWSALPGVTDSGVEDFNEVWALDPQHVSILADFHTAKTTNGGVSWTWDFVPNELVYQAATVVMSPTRRFVSSIVEGVAVHETTDDGANWTPRLVDFEAQGMKDFIRLGNGAFIGVTSDGDLYRSTDECLSWQNATLSPNDEERVTISAFARAADGTIFAGSTQPGQQVRRFHKSVDGGDSFVETPEPGINFMNTLVWMPGGVLLAGGSGSPASRVWRSTNDGASWTSHVLPNSFTNGVQCFDLEVMSATTAYAAAFGTQGNAIFWTTDSGVTWEQRTTGIPATTSLYSVDFIDAQTGYAAGAASSSPRIYRTTNAGSTWHSIGTAGLSASVADTYWFDTQNAVATTGQASPGLFRTTNGGTSWTLLSSDRATRFSFADQTRGYVAEAFQFGQLSTVLETTDAGATWSSLSVPNHQGAETVFALPDGFISGGYRSTIVRARIAHPTSVDGGSRAAFPLRVRGSVGSTPEIAFTAVEHGALSILVIDAQGRLVRRLFDGDVTAGEVITRSWDGRDDRGATVSAGVYFLRASNGHVLAQGRITLLRD